MRRIPRLESRLGCGGDVPELCSISFWPARTRESQASQDQCLKLGRDLPDLQFQNRVDPRVATLRTAYSMCTALPAWIPGFRTYQPAYEVLV